MVNSTYKHKIRDTYKEAVNYLLLCSSKPQCLRQMKVPDHQALLFYSSVSLVIILLGARQEKEKTHGITPIFMLVCEPSHPLSKAHPVTSMILV